MLKNGRVATRLPAVDLARARSFYADKLGLLPQKSASSLIASPVWRPMRSRIGPPALSPSCESIASWIARAHWTARRARRIRGQGPGRRLMIAFPSRLFAPGGDYIPAPLTTCAG